MDIGYHFDLTDSLMRGRGYSNTAIQLAQLANGLTDLVGNVVTAKRFKPVREGVQAEAVKISNAVGNAASEFMDQVAAAKFLHCDNLFEVGSPGDVEKFWRQFLANIRNVLEQSPVGDDEQLGQFVMFLFGISLHTLQDLCSHSNWSMLPGAITTWSDNPRILKEYHKESVFAAGVPSHPQLITGEYEYVPADWPNWKPSPANHPEHDQMHLDHQDREVSDGVAAARGGATNWDEAYVTAFISGQDLLSQMEVWLETNFPGSLAKVKRIDLNPLKTANLTAVLHRVSYAFMWLKLEQEHDGHWKGPGSGDLDSMIANLGLRVALFAADVKRALIKLFVEIIATDAQELKLFAQFYQLLAPNKLTQSLYDKNNMGESAETVSTTFDPTGLRVVMITVTKVFLPLDGFTQRHIDFGSEPDPYVLVTATDKNASGLEVMKRVYRERTLQNLVALRAPNATLHPHQQSPSWQPWQVIHLIGNDVVKIDFAIHMYDEDTLSGGSDDVLRIHPSSPDRHNLLLTLNLTTLPLESPDAPELECAPPVAAAGVIPIANGNQPVTFKVQGSVIPAWFTTPARAGIEFHITVAEVS